MLSGRQGAEERFSSRCHAKRFFCRAFGGHIAALLQKFLKEKEDIPFLLDQIHASLLEAD
jgi:hypothetical protein